MHQKSDETICSDAGKPTTTAVAVGNTITWYTDLTGGSEAFNPTQVGAGTSTYYADEAAHEKRTQRHRLPSR
jgi:hypothetical protein